MGTIESVDGQVGSYGVVKFLLLLRRQRHEQNLFNQLLVPVRFVKPVGNYSRLFSGLRLLCDWFYGKFLTLSIISGQIFCL